MPLVRPSGSGQRPRLAAYDPQSISVNPKAEAKSKAKAKATGKNHMVLACQLRARSTKDFVSAERALRKALEDAQTLLSVRAPKILGEEACQSDPTLDLLRARLQLVETALGAGRDGNETTLKKMSKELFSLAVQDPYLKDLRTTLLSDEEACRTLEAVRHARNVTLNLHLECSHRRALTFQTIAVDS